LAATTVDDQLDYELVQLDGSGETNNPIGNSEHQEEETRLTVEKRADLLARTLLVIIKERRKPQPHKADGSDTAKVVHYKNDPFRKNISHNNLL
jgi:hypothetical protein